MVLYTATTREMAVFNAAVTRESTVLPNTGTSANTDVHRNERNEMITMKVERKTSTALITTEKTWRTRTRVNRHEEKYRATASLNFVMSSMNRDDTTRNKSIPMME